MVARKNENEDSTSLQPGRTDGKRRRELARERQREVEREFLFEQLDELAGDFGESPEQIGRYLADLEAAGLLMPADKGLIFRRLWETMGPAFADRAFGMVDRALASTDALNADIQTDAFASFEGDVAVFTDASEYARIQDASRVLEGLARALGLEVEVPRAQLKRRPDHIEDPDVERAAKTDEILQTLAPQLGIDAARYDIQVDDEAHEKTGDQGIYGLMTDGTVFLDPDIYDPETVEGRGLLAHEVVHLAQLENRLRGANDMPNIYEAEAEAEALSSMFAEGSQIKAPLASLTSYDQAACGVRAMHTPTPTPVPHTGTTEVVHEPPIYQIVENQIQVPTINYKVDKDKITETMPDAQPIMKQLAETLKSYPEITKIKVEGFTSTTASAEHNLALSQRRCDNAKAWLTNKEAVAGVTMETKGWGEDKDHLKVKTGDNVEVTANRRTEFTIAEVNGQPAPANWHPTKRVLKTPGRTIVRYLDENGKVVREEVIPDQPGQPQSQSTAGGSAGTPPASDQGHASTTGTATAGTGASGSATSQASQQTAQAHGASPTTAAASSAGTGCSKGGSSSSGGGSAGSTTAPATTETANSGGTPAGPASGEQRAQAARAETRNPRQPIRFRQTVTPRPKKGKKLPRRFAGPALRAVAQPKAAPGGITSNEVAETTRSTGGEPIPGTVRDRFEQAFGQDFGDVRIHRGSAQAVGIGATAFARGTDIHFAPGRFDADSSKGLATLGHELTHIVQQRAGRVAIPQGMGTHVNVERALEAEADLLGSRAAAGQSVHVQGSSAALYSRAARGEADTIQFENGTSTATGGAAGGTRPNECELRLGGQRIRARMPASPTSPGRVRVDFSSVASIPGLTLGSAEVEFDAAWTITRGTLTASVAVGEYVRADNITLQIQRKEDGATPYAEVSAEVNGATFTIPDLFTSTIDLRLSSAGVTGTAHINATTPITLGQGIELTSGTLDLSLQNGGTMSASGTLVGNLAGIGEVTVTASAMTGGNLSGSVEVRLTQALSLPGVEGMSLESGNIRGTYTKGQEWSVEGNLNVKVRDWIGAEINAKYTQPLGEASAAGDMAAHWEIHGMLQQLQPYTVGEGENALTLSNGQLDLYFKTGTFEKVDAKADFDTTNFNGHIEGTFKVPEAKLDAVGTIDLKPERLPIGSTGINVTAVHATATIEANSLTKIQGNTTIVFPYENQDTFKLEGSDVTIRVPDAKVDCTATVTTLRPLTFGDQAGYNGIVREGAVGTLSVADNQLLGISGGLAYEVNHASEKIGEGTVDVNFTGPSQQLNATATFHLTAENGFGIPDRTAGPVYLLAGGEFVLTITNNQLGSATVTNVGYEVKQTGDGATGKFGGSINGSYDFQASKLNATGTGSVKSDWTLGDQEGVSLCFKQGGNIDVAVADNTLTRVHGAFPYECNIAPTEAVPQTIKLTGDLTGDYSDETKKFTGALTGALSEKISIPMGDGGADHLEIQAGASFKATVTESRPEAFTIAFTADYYRGSEHFLTGQVENATYNFQTGKLDFTGKLTLQSRVEKSTDDNKWTLAIDQGTEVGVEVHASKLEALTGQINFEILKDSEKLFYGSLNDAHLDVQELKFSGNIDVKLAKDLEYPRSADGATATTPEGTPPVQAVAKKDESGITGRIDNNALTQITAKLVFGVKLGGEEYGAGELNGQLDMGQFKFSGTGAIHLIKDLKLGGVERTEGGDPVATWSLAFASGQGLDIKITDNALDEAHVALGASLYRDETQVATATVDGNYKLGSTKGFNGTVTANVIAPLDLTQDDRFHYFFEPGTTFNAVMQDNNIQTVDGTFKLLLKEIPEGERDAVRITLTGVYTRGTGFSAGGVIEVLNDLKVGQGTDYKFFVAQGSGGQANITGLKVTKLHGDLTLNVYKDTTHFAKGTFNLNYDPSSTAAKIDCSGTVALLVRTDVTPAGASDTSWKFFLCEATGVQFKVTQSELDYVKGQVNTAVEYKNTEVITGNLNVNYQHSGSPNFSCDGSATVTNEIDLDIHFDDYKLIIEPSTGVTFKVEQNSFKSASGSVKVRIDDTKGGLARIELGGDYNHTTKKFNGNGSATLLRKVEVGTSADGSYKFNVLDGGTGAIATVADNKLTEIRGTLRANVEDTVGEFLLAEGTVIYRRTDQGQKVSTENAQVRCTRTKEIPLAGGDWKISIVQETSASLVVTDNELLEVNGVVKIEITKGDEFAAKVDVNGSWKKADGVNGTGRAELTKDYKVGESAPYKFTALKGGTNAELEVKSSSVYRVGGNVEFQIDEGTEAFVKGHATITYIVPDAKLVEASGEGTLQIDKKLAEFSGFKLFAAKQSSAHFAAADNALKSLGGHLNLRVDEGESELARGEVNAEWQVASGLFTGNGEVSLTRDYAVSTEGLNGHGQPESWGLAFSQGSKLALSVTENVFDMAQVDIGASGYHNGEKVATGRLFGSYKVGTPEGFTGGIEFAVSKRVPLLEGSGRFDYHIDEGTSFNGQTQSGTIKSVTGTLNLAATEGSKDAVKVHGDFNYTAGQGVNAGGTIEVVNDILIKEGGQWKLFLASGSGGDATVTASKLVHVGGTIKLRVDKGTSPFATGDFTASYDVADGTNAQVSGAGRVELVGRTDVTGDSGGDFRVFLTAGTGVGASLKNGELEWVDGQIKGEINYKGPQLAEFDVSGKYTATGTPSFDADGSLKTVVSTKIRDFEGWTLYLGQGASITGSIRQFKLDHLTANIPLELHKPDGTKVVEATLNGDYNHGEGTFSGTGSANVVKQITVAENVGGYSFYVEPGSKANAQVTANSLKSLSGTLIVTVGDAPGPAGQFLKATGTANYEGGAQSKVGIQGTLEVTRAKKLDPMPAGYIVEIRPGSGGTLNVANNELVEIGGTVNVGIQKNAGTDFATIKLSGSYTKAAGFTGRGEAELCEDWRIIETRIGADTYSLWCMKGTGANINLEGSSIKHIGGTVKAMIRDGAEDFIEITANADFDYPNSKFTGDGSASVLKDKKLAAITTANGPEELWLAKGTGANGAVTANVLTRLGGNIQVKLKDNEGFYLTCALEGSFDATGGTGFTGSGGVTVTRDKKLAQIGNYAFWIAKGAGATAHLAENKLTKVDGNVPFKVFDNQADPLLTGSAEGVYLAETQKFSGRGEVYLGRDVEYQIGGGKLVFEKGSGGYGVVTDNELKELGGTLKVAIHDATGPIVHVSADGKFDAVNKKIIYVDGEASLLRPIDVGGTGANAILRINTLTGRARVENNELKELSGALDFTMPKLNNMKGHFEGGWQKGAGTDVFWGSGDIQFELFNDPAKGRKLSGAVHGEYNKDGTFRINGEVDYKLNPMIGGKLTVDVDQTLDPKLGGTLEVSNVVLMQGRDLFKWSKDFQLLNQTIMVGPVPLTLNGGVGVGFGVSMLPLTFSASIGVSNFRPLAANIQVPDFEARASMTTGIRLAASLKPYFGVGLGLGGVAEAGVALQGEVSLGVDANITPYALLRGVGGVYSGELGIGLNIVGSGALAMTPQLYAVLMQKRFTYDITEIRHELGPLFSYDYNYKMPFGDQPAAPTQGGAEAGPPVAAAATTARGEERKTPAPPDPATSGAPNRPAATPGGPDASATANDSAESSEREGPMGELMTKMDQVKDWGEKIGRIGAVGGFLINLLTFMITIPQPFGLIAAGAYFAYKVISGEITFELIGQAFRDLMSIIELIGANLASILPDWLVNLWNYLNGKTWDEILNDMIMKMAGFLGDMFPSARRVIDALAGVAATVISTIARVIRSIINGSFGLDDFLDICRSVGGAVLSAVIALVGDAVVEAVGDAVNAVGDFIGSLW